MSPAPIVTDEIARLGARGQKGNRIVQRRRPPDRSARPRLGERIDDQLARDALDRVLARRVDLGDADDVGAGQRSGELACEVTRA